MKGYKVFNPNMTSNHGSIIFEVGKSYKHGGKVTPCQSGFHFCVNPADCFSYYKFDSANIVCEVEASGEIVPHEDKHACSDLQIVRKIEWSEVLTIVNTGKDNSGLKNSGDSNSGDSNSGYRNSGNSNSGDRNSGNSNSGDRNSGDRNSGNRNSGDRNSGDRNSGNWNSGNRNSGYRNSGNWNSGNWNSGNSNSGDSNSGYRNSGAFCTDPNPKVWLFDQHTEIYAKDWERSDAFRTMADLLETNMWIYSENMTEAERVKHPSHETTGGYLKSKTMHEAWADMWGNLSESKKSIFTSLPNFDAEKFFTITGIKL